MQEHSEANHRWKNQVEESRQSNSYGELLGFDGEQIEFEWNIFPGLTSLEIFQKIQKDLKGQNIEPEKFEDRTIFMLMFNDIDWTKMGNSKRCIPNSEQVKKFTRRDSREDTGHSLAWETRRSGTEISATHLKENGIPSLHRWWNDSKKLVTEYSRASVL